MTTPATGNALSTRGTISVHARGFGFLNFEREEAAPASAFVPPPLLNRFLEDDLVDARVTTAPDGRMTVASAVLVERRRQELFGTLVRRGGRPHLAVDRLVANTDWPFAAGAAPDAGLAEGTALVARAGAGEVELLRVVPPGADLALERCIVRHGVRSTFSEELLALARDVQSEPRIAHRRDLRELPTVTIDSAATRDIDDALSVLAPADDGALRVLVSIADVDAFVAEGSPLDREARARGTSVYLAGRVVPMFPEALCEDRVSLREGQERPALTVELRIDPEGEITAVDVYASLIRSHARLTYEAVARLLSTGASREVPDAVVPTLRWLRTAAARLSAVRAARGGIELVREEAYVTFAASGAPVEVAARIDTEAHRLVERLMVAANECVARWLVERGVPGIFRVHDAPTEARTEQLKRFAHNFGVEAGFGPRLSPRGLLAFDAQLRDTANAPAIRTVMGRVLGPARYSALPGLHFGLGAPLYLHFTSPIRRYADLAVHRVVKRYLEGERQFEPEALGHAPLALELNRTSLRADKAETERHRMLVAMLFAGRVGERLSGNVVSVKPFGLVVQLLGTGVTGTITLESLPGGPYAVQLAAQAIEPVRPAAEQPAARGGARRFSVGDPLEVEVAGAQPELGRIDLHWVE